MEHYQRVIIDLLNAAINKKKITFNRENNIQWSKVVKEAKQHKISALIYSSIDRNSLKYIDNNTLDGWKREIFKDNLIQIRHINSIVKLIDNLSKRGIEIILLKGLVLRNFYPRPEYRTMCDADILVKLEDYLEVKDYLIKNGYECDEDNYPVHQCFTCCNGPIIEVHWKLVNDDYLKGNIKNFEVGVWKRSIEFNICGVNCKTLSNEDFIIHMCLHMAVHAKYSGFGLRQLYDIAVFIQNKNIDWTSVERRISLYGILKFTKGLFELLNQLFNINVPKDILKNQCVSKLEMQLLLNNILASGVHGKKEEVEGFATLCRCGNNKQYRDSNIRRVFKLIFPARTELNFRYKYAKTNVLLLPIAWIHRFFTGIFVKRYGIIKMLKYSKKSFKILSIRKKFIKNFEL